MSLATLSRITLSLTLVLGLSLPVWAGQGKGGSATGVESPSKGKAQKGDKQKGLDQAAMNAVRNAYKFLEQGKPQKALKELEKARRKAPNNYWVNYYSAGAYHQLGEYRQARPYWDAAFDNADDPALRSRVRTAEAFTRYMDGERDQARTSLRMALEMDGGNVRARELLATYAAPIKGGAGQVQAGVSLSDVKGFMSYFMVQMP